jgi:hypothetical protein
MTGLENKLKTTIFVFALLFAASEVHAAHQHIGIDSRFLDSKVVEFELDNEPLISGIWKLAKAPEPFAFGFENILKSKLTDPDTQDPRLKVQLKDTTVRGVLDALCRADPRFMWSADGNTVNVFPRAIENDTNYLLNRKLETLELKNATDVQDGLLAIVRQLPPPIEQIANAQLGGDDPYPREPWTVTYHNLTVRQVVNRLALHGGPCGIWIFGGARDFRSFGFFNTYLRCPREPAPEVVAYP